MDDDYNYELELQEMILKKQKELEASRRKLTIIKNARYRGDEDDASEMLWWRMRILTRNGSWDWW